MNQLTMPEVASRLNVSLLTVYRYIKVGRLRATKGPGRGGTVSVSERALAEFVAERDRIARNNIGTKAAADLLGVSTRTIQGLVASGDLERDVLADGPLRITRRSLVAYANRRADLAIPAPRGATVVRSR